MVFKLKSAYFFLSFLQKTLYLYQEGQGPQIQPKCTNLQNIDQWQTGLTVKGVSYPSIRTSIRVCGLNLCDKRTFGNISFNAQTVFDGSELWGVVIFIRKDHSDSAKWCTACWRGKQEKWHFKSLFMRHLFASFITEKFSSRSIFLSEFVKPFWTYSDIPLFPTFIL